MTADTHERRASSTSVGQATMPTEQQRLTYRDTFRSLHNQAFQAWFETLAVALHPIGDFQAIRNTSGDGGLDGFAINSNLVYQVFAPARMHELRDGDTAAKLRTDFVKAHSTLHSALKHWVFVHNHPEAKIGPLSAAACADLKASYPSVEFGILNIDSLWDQLCQLPDLTLVALFGSPSPPLPLPLAPLPPDIQAVLDDADALVQRSRYDDARMLVEQVLRSAEPNGLIATAARIDLAEIDIFQDSDVVDARDALLTCLQRLAPHDTKRRQQVLALLGDAEALLGHVGAAHSLFCEARDLARDREDRFAEAHALIGLCGTDELRGQLTDAERTIDEALTLLRAEYRVTPTTDVKARRKVATNIAAALSTRAHLMTHGGRLTEALVSLEEAIPLFAEADSQDNIGRATLLKAQILLTEANRPTGFDLLTVAGGIFHAVGNSPWECRALRHIAQLLEMAGQEDAATALLIKAVDLLSSGQWKSSESVPYLLELGRLAWQAKRAEESHGYIEKAKVLAQEGRPSGLLADCFLAEASLISRDEADRRVARRELFILAKQDLHNALEACEVRGRRAVLAERMGQLHGYLEDVREARSWFEKSLREFETVGDVFGVARCLSLIAATARADEADTEAIAALERVLEFTKTLPLYHERAGALHDLSVLRLTHLGDSRGARRNHDEARALAEKHGFKDVLDALDVSGELLDHAERVGQPAERDLAEIVTELHRWCELFPAKRDAIVPLWYFIHRTNIWSICRSMLGVRFLVRADDRVVFDSVVDAVKEHGDLFLLGVPFQITSRMETETIPCPPDMLVPPHIPVAAFKSVNALPPKEAARALVGALKNRAYVLLPLSEAREGTNCWVLGRHLRLPSIVAEVMLDPETLSRRVGCVPLGSGRLGSSDAADHDVTLLQLMRVAWENGLIPVVVGGLPVASGVKAVASTTIEIYLEMDAGRSRRAWSRLLRDASRSPRDALTEFRTRWTSLVGGKTSDQRVAIATVYALQFRAGRKVAHPAVALRL